MQITVEEVVYEVVKEEAIKNCRGCFLYEFTDEIEECVKITGIDCRKEKIIFLKTPAKFVEKIEQLEKQTEILKEKLYDIQQYIEHKKVCGKSINFSDADLTTNEIMNELEEILYWEE